MNIDEIHEDYYAPDGGEVEWRRFPLDLKKLKLYYDPSTLTWSTGRVDAFKNALDLFIKLRIPDCTVVITDLKQADRSYELLVTVTSESLGKLSTQFEVGIIMNKDCPHNLPQIIANEFKKELEAGK